jgi:hypothetical protein
MLFDSGHGTAPDLVYSRWVPYTPFPTPGSFDKKKCTLIIVEISFCRDLDCDIKFEKKTEKNCPLMAALKKY